MRDAPADADRAVVEFDRFQPLDAPDVDNYGGRGKAQFQHWNEAMTAGEDFAIFAVFVNELQRFFDRFRRKVFKIIRNHNSPNLGEGVKRRRGEGGFNSRLPFYPFTLSPFHLFTYLSASIVFQGG